MVRSNTQTRPPAPPCDGDCAPLLQRLSHSLGLTPYSRLRIRGSEKQKRSPSLTPTRAVWPGSHPNSWSTTSIKASAPWGSECWDRAAKRIDLGPTCPFQRQVYLIRRTLHQLLEVIQRDWKIFFSLIFATHNWTWADFKNLLNTLTSEECRMVLDKARRKQIGYVQKPLATPWELQQASYTDSWSSLRCECWG